MKISQRIGISGAFFSIVAFALETGFCEVGISQCTKSENFSHSAMLIPYSILLTLYCLTGIGVAFLIERLVQLSRNPSPVFRFSLSLAAGGVSGWIASSLANVVLGGAPLADSFVNAVINCPFTIGGIACALVNAALVSRDPIPR